MKLIYKGKYDGVIEEFSSSKNIKNATKYKEADSLEEMAKIITIPANVIQFILLLIVILIVGVDNFERTMFILIIAFIVSLFTMIPHELLHGVCYKKKVYLYTNLKQLMLFIVGEDHLSKWMFIFMCMFPNIVFGFIPYIIFLINSKFIFLGMLGAMCISYGMGDYYNVWNTIKQVPRNAKVFSKGHNSYWYIPSK
jgi:Zn-dependent protease with chaperone function